MELLPRRNKGETQGNKHFQKDFSEKKTFLSD